MGAGSYLAGARGGRTAAAPNIAFPLARLRELAAPGRIGSLSQTVGPVAAELERRGITTVALQLLREVAQRVRPPRALFVPFPMGLALLEGANLRPPVLVDYRPPIRA